MQRRVAFTLIELLVVIAIIAILAAILFPVFARAREAARKTQCLSNVKQLALGTLMYAQDYDETFPGMEERGDEGDAHPLIGGPFSGTTPNGGSAWYAENKVTPADLLNPYTKNDGIFECANLGQRAVRKTFPNYSNKVWRGDGSSQERRAGSYLWFCAHAYLGSKTKSPTNLGYLYALLEGFGILPAGRPDDFTVCQQPMASISRPAQKPMFIDDTWGTNHEGLSNDAFWFLPPGPLCAAVYGSPTACKPASTGWNVGYADGHAKYTKTSFYQTIDLWLHLNSE